MSPPPTPSPQAIGPIATSSPPAPSALQVSEPAVPGDLKEVKIKLPVHQVLGLHYARLKSGRNFSETVSSALTRYFNELRSP